MKQVNLFGEDFKKDESENKYSSKIQTPIYEPKNKKPHVAELYDKEKTRRLMRKIDASNVTAEEKIFLLEASKRHVIFNYEKIADYYAHSNKEMQELMEDSALVIIDFEKAIQLGYVKLCDEIRTQYLEQYGE